VGGSVTVSSGAASVRSFDEIVSEIGAISGPLIDGTDLTCPLCEHTDNILAYRPLQTSTKYASQVVTPLKCKACGHVFALRP
jgi:hypothetical protein